MARVWRISFISHNANGVVNVNDLHFQTDVATLGAEPPGTDVLDSFDTHFTAGYRAILPVSSVLDSLEAREEVVPGSGDVPLAASKVKSVAGLLATADTKLSPAHTLILKLRTNAAIRSGRGYVSLPSPLSSSACDGSGNFLTSGTYWSAVLAFAALVDDSFSTGGTLPATCNPVVYSRTRHARGFSPFVFSVVEGVPSNVMRWRRSRMTAP